MNSFWLHPSLILIFGSLLLLLVPARLKKGYLLLIPILLFARILTMAHGEFGQVHVQQWTLVLNLLIQRRDDSMYAADERAFPPPSPSLVSASNCPCQCPHYCLHDLRRRPVTKTEAAGARRSFGSSRMAPRTRTN